MSNYGHEHLYEVVGNTLLPKICRREADDRMESIFYFANNVHKRFQVS